MNKICLIFFIAALSVAAAQLKCETPKEWHARIFEVRHGSDPAHSFGRFSHFSYDAINNRTRREEELVEDDEREFYDEIFLHREGVGFRINLRTKICEKFNLREPFRVIGVPSSAHFDRLVEIGADVALGTGVEVAVFEGETMERGFYAGEWIPAKIPNFICLPVSDFYFSRTYGSYTHWSIYDVELGIRDPNVFVPPPQCF